MRTRGGRGSKIPKILRTSLMVPYCDCPYANGNDNNSVCAWYYRTFPDRAWRDQPQVVHPKGTSSPSSRCPLGWSLYEYTWSENPIASHLHQVVLQFTIHKIKDQVLQAATFIMTSTDVAFHINFIDKKKYIYMLIFTRRISYYTALTALLIGYES